MLLSLCLRTWHKTLPLVFLLSTSISPTHADETAIGEIPEHLLAWIEPGSRETDVQSLLNFLLKEGDFDGKGLDRAGIQSAQTAYAAEQRAERVADVLKSDLDGNWIVTSDEAMLAARIRAGAERHTAQYDAFVVGAYFDTMRFDIDGDSRATLTEITERAASLPYSDIKTRTLSYLIGMDPNHDGRLTQEELDKEIQRTFQLLDKDRDGSISKEELLLVRALALKAEIDIQLEPCELPSAIPDSAPVWLAIRDGGAPSNVTVAGQNNITTVSDVQIEPGAGKIQLILSSSRPMIWRFSGAVERLAQVVAIPANIFESVDAKAANVGVVGLAGSIVQVLPPGSCGVLHAMSGFMPDFPDAAPKSNEISPDLTKAMLNSLAEKLGKEPNLLLRRSDGHIQVPSGTVNAIVGAHSIAEIDPDSVVPKASAASYVVLPGQAGLNQLISEGKLEKVGEKYRILRPIQYFPAFEDREPIYLLPRDVTLPTGMPTYPRYIRPEGL
jgi:hypothetical protein